MEKTNTISKSGNIFNKYPKITIIFVIILFIVTLIGVLIIIGSFVGISRNEKYGLQRNIRLREHHPFKEKIMLPSDEYLNKTDTLFKKRI